MKRLILWEALALLLIAAVTVYAVENTTWGQIKALWSDTPVAKLTVSSTKAGGYRGERVQRSVYQAEIKASNVHDLDKQLTYFTNDIVYDAAAAPPPAQGKEAYRFVMQYYFQGFPDMQLNEQRILCAGNICVGEWILTGTHLGDFMGIPPTGSEIQNPNLKIVEFDGDKIEKMTHYWDTAGVMVQLGVMPAGELPPLVPSFELPDPVATGLSPMAAEAEFITRLNTQDPAAIAEMFHPDGQISFAALGMVPLDRDTFTALMELYYQGFPDLQHSELRRVNLGDGWVLWEGSVTGTHDGPYLGIPATGNSVVNRAAYLHRWDADGLLREGYVYFDHLGVLVQIGAIPAP